ncbi:MAG TPA: histidinol-phosphatase [Gemmatimonadaceae bacterium]
MDSLALKSVMDLARVTGEVAMRHFRTRVRVETKSDGSPVSDADRAAERAAREWVDTRFPDDGVLGEEYGELRPGAARRWIVDPIDGTKAFVRDVPLWGSLVALCEGSHVLAGSAFFPALDEIIAAAPGQGCWWNGVRASVSRTRGIDEATILTTDCGFAGNRVRQHGWEALASRARLSRTWGDCYGYLLVATGRADVMLDPVLAPWDAAALYPIIREAGGVFTDWNGEDTAFGGSAIATNRALDSAVRSLLSTPDRG